MKYVSNFSDIEKQVMNQARTASMGGNRLGIDRSQSPLFFSAAERLVKRGLLKHLGQKVVPANQHRSRPMTLEEYAITQIAK